MNRNQRQDQQRGGMSGRAGEQGRYGRERGRFDEEFESRGYSQASRDDSGEEQEGRDWQRAGNLGRGNQGGARGGYGGGTERGGNSGYDAQSSYGMGQGGRDWDQDQDNTYGSRNAEGSYAQGDYAQRGGYGGPGRGGVQRSRSGFSEGGQGGYYGNQSQGAGYGRQAQRDLSQRRGPKGYTRSDERIKEDLCEQLMQQEEFELEDVSIEVKDGKVTLDGSVPERTMKHRIEDVACYCMGVKEVENRMRVSRDQPARSSGEKGSTAGQQSRSKREH